MSNELFLVTVIPQGASRGSAFPANTDVTIAAVLEKAQVSTTGITVLLNGSVITPAQYNDKFPAPADGEGHELKIQAQKHKSGY